MGLIEEEVRRGSEKKGSSVEWITGYEGAQQGKREGLKRPPMPFLYIGICFILELHSSTLILRKISLGGAGEIGGGKLVVEQ